jgi:carboxypeptidase C (cathepsin A)
MTLNGLILVSGLLSFDAYTGDKAWQALLPAYTAVAHYHKRLSSDLQADLPKALAEARDFMRTEYAAALFQGASMTAAMRGRVVAKLSRLTGLPAQVIENNDLRIDNEVFRKELLRDQGLILGRYDARITGSDADPASRHPEFDPSFTAIDGAFSAAINAYVRGELKFEDDLPYGVLNRINDWKGGSHDASPNTGVRQDFASEMKEDPHLHVLVLNGRCDLACPVNVIRYDIDHLKLDPASRARITYAEYEAGHMMYINPPDLRKMQKDIGQFIRSR